MSYLIYTYLISTSELSLVDSCSLPAVEHVSLTLSFDRSDECCSYIDNYINHQR